MLDHSANMSIAIKYKSSYVIIQHKVLLDWLTSIQACLGVLLEVWFFSCNFSLQSRGCHHPDLFNCIILFVSSCKNHSSNYRKKGLLLLLTVGCGSRCRLPGITSFVLFLPDITRCSVSCLGQQLMLNTYKHAHTWICLMFQNSALHLFHFESLSASLGKK